jgi:small subunit ribosomal protein S4e
MKKHLKRQKIPKGWPIQRKGTKYIVKPNSDLEKGIPLLIALRDMLEITNNKKEVKKVLHEGKILLNEKPARNEKMAILLFDIIKIVPSKKSYQLNLSSGGKFVFEEIKDEESGFKISKVIGKKTLKGKKEQINLLDGRNFISDLKCEVGDSVRVNTTNKKIEKCIPLKEKSEVVVFLGKHSGKRGKINEIRKEQKSVEIEVGKEKINVLIKQIIAVK